MLVSHVYHYYCIYRSVFSSHYERKYTKGWNHFLCDTCINVVLYKSIRNQHDIKHYLLLSVLLSEQMKTHVVWICIITLQWMCIMFFSRLLYSILFVNIAFHISPFGNIMYNKSMSFYTFYCSFIFIRQNYEIAKLSTDLITVTERKLPNVTHWPI